MRSSSLTARFPFEASRYGQPGGMNGDGEWDAAALQFDLNLLQGHVHDDLPIPGLAAGLLAAHFRYSQPNSTRLRCSMHYVGCKCALVHDGLLQAVLRLLNGKTEAKS